MTKDELNEVLKEDDLELDKQFNGIGKAEFIVRTIYSPNKQAINFNGVDFYVQDRSCFSPWTLKALADYAYTPIEERKPKPQLYNVVIGRDLENTGFYTAWVKTESLQISGSVSEQMLYGKSRFKFTKEDIEEYKSRLSPIEQSIVDLGTFPVGTDYKKKFAHD